MKNRNYVPRHKVKHPCKLCGYDIMHDGVEYARCHWWWTVQWVGLWYKIAQLHAIVCADVARDATLVWHDKILPGINGT